MTKARAIAFYLPQFHPIPENSLWWGEGFTEWTNVRKARPLYPGHRQPTAPGELGYYDLRDPLTRQKQAALAAEHGVEAFCYWHYWFGNGRQLLEKPLNDVLDSGEPDFPFCVGWANHNWTKRWGAGPERMLMEQTYPGAEDNVRHYRTLERAFLDRRYLRVEGKPLFFVFDPEFPGVDDFLRCWTTLAQQSGLPGLYFVAHLNNPASSSEAYLAKGFDAVAPNLTVATPKLRNPLWIRALRKVGVRVPTLFFYRRFTADPVFRQPLAPRHHGLIVPNWDDTPRRKERGFVLHGSTPERFRDHLRDVLGAISQDEAPERRIVFIRSWNEWAEGNYLEPDDRYGRRYLEVLKQEITA